MLMSCALKQLLSAHLIPRSLSRSASPLIPFSLPSFCSLPPSPSSPLPPSEERLGHSGRLSHDTQPPVTESSATAGYQHNDDAAATAAAAAAEEQRLLQQQLQQQAAEQQAAEPQRAAEQQAAEQQAAEAASMAEEVLPGIEGLRILGDPVLGGKLTACGHSVNGTALCVFQVSKEERRGEDKAEDKRGEGRRRE